MRRRDDLRQRARAMRLAGATYPQIVAALGVSKSTVSLWVRDVPHQPKLPLPDHGRRAAADRYFAQRRRTKFIERQNEKLAWANEIGELTARELVIAGAVAYWAEGTKSKPWRPSESIAFINSDPDMIRLFVAWLELLGVGRDRLRLRVSIHESADVPAAESFWADVVGVRVDVFSRATIKTHTPKTVRSNTGDSYHGCLIVRVLGSASLYRQTEGIWWSAAASARRRLVDRQMPSPLALRK